MKFSLLPVIVIAVLHSSNASAEDSGLPGWIFQPPAKEALFEAHPDQIGTLREDRDHSHFLTVSVIVRRAIGLSKRPVPEQLKRLEAEMKALMHREKSAPNHAAKKILPGGLIAFETEYGKPGKGLSWAAAKVRGDTVVMLWASSRDSTPPETARDEFFKMAREFTPPKAESPPGK